METKIFFVSFEVGEIPGGIDPDPEMWDWDDDANWPGSQVTAVSWSEESRVLTLCIRAERNAIPRAWPWDKFFYPVPVVVV